MSDLVGQEDDPHNAHVRRRLTTILHGDVCGYSRLMEMDEVATLENLKACKSTVASFLERHHGRVINWTGDGLLAEFDSVVEAVQCAVEIQRELKAKNDLLDREKRMDFRMGINLGDVMVDNDELFGEGVNIAARLQSIAPVGGVLISGTAFDQVRNKLGLAFEFVGRQSVKNIAEPIPAYAIDLDPNAKPNAKKLRSPQSQTINASYHTATASADVFPPTSRATRDYYAGFWRRAAAFLVDGSIVYLVSTTLADISYMQNSDSLWVLIYLFYMAGFESSPWQATIGKKIMGIRVVGTDGESLSLMRAMGRNAAKIVSLATVGIGFLIAAFTDRRQTLHDKIAETLALNEDAEPITSRT